MMASPPFQLEDQTDHDFFDKLVEDDDEIICHRSVVSGLLDGVDSDEAKAFSNLSEVGSAGAESVGDIGFGGDDDDYNENGIGDGVVSVPHDEPKGNNVVASEINESTGSNVVESTVCPMGTEVAAGYPTSTGGVKEIDWSTFNSEPHVQSGIGVGSYSDLFNEFGENSEDPFSMIAESKDTGRVSENPVELRLEQNQVAQFYGTGVAQTVEGEDLNSSQYWEDLYPGWRYDPTTGQWHQLDVYTADANTNVYVQDDSNVNVLSANNAVQHQKSEINYLQQTAQSSVGSIAEVGTTGTVSNWNQGQQENDGYPAHMGFDPQYPGWYYDTIVQEWRSLESYTSGINQLTNLDHNQQKQNAYVQTVASFGENSYNSFGENSYNSYGRLEQVDNYQSRDLSIQNQVVDTHASINNYNQNNMTNWQPEPVAKTFNPAGQGFGGTGGTDSFQSYVHSENVMQKSDYSWMEPTQQMNVSPSYFEIKTPANFTQLPLGSLSEGRSSAGRPPHALVTFGFGGKLIVMGANNSVFSKSTSNSQDSAGGVVNVVNMAEVVLGKIDDSNIGLGGREYFQSLCQRSFPGPLAGGSVGSRELNKWIDDKITNCEYCDPDYRKGEISKMLFSLLKISCQYYGKLRSPFGSDQTLKDDCPESAVSKLFLSHRKDGVPLNEYGAHKLCLQDFPPEPFSQAAAHDVQKLLVSGRMQEALKCAQESRLWGPALVLATQLGDQYFSETVKQMSLQHLVAGSPLRTLCLLIGRQPADVFSNPTSNSNVPSAFNFPHPIQNVSNRMLDEWVENLAIITANRTKEDERVIIHLGDCLWKERDQVAAAHICYLVAEANFELHSDSARLCLIGADHWKFPRTYANPEAIQRTELYEYSKVLGNPQFILLPFQPYKIIYAHMLAEVGKLSDSLKYCQAIVKSLKTGRDPEVDNWKQLVSSLEERIRTHQQGGYMAPAKLVGKLLNFFDSTAHRVVGGLPPPVPTLSHSKVKHNEPVNQQGGPRVFSSQSTMAMSTLVPSASVEPLNDWTGGSSPKAISNRSISEPDIGKTPKVGSSKEENSEKSSASGRSSRVGRFGSQLLQKTFGLVLRSRADNQAKLGEKNTFYYDEKLKQWVEEGANPPAEEAALPPPPTTATLHNRLPSQTGINFTNGNLHSTDGPDIMSSLTSDLSSGIPPIPPSSNQFSSQGRMGVRARYVDTFNKQGGTPTTLFQSPSIPTPKPKAGFNPNFFIPTPSVSLEETPSQSTAESVQEANLINEIPSALSKDYSFPSTPSSTAIMQRFPSMDNIVQKKMGITGNGNDPLHLQSRRASSWSGNLCDANDPSKLVEVVKPLRPTIGMSNKPQPMRVSTSTDNLQEDLREVEL